MNKKFIFLASTMLLNSCVGQITNNIDAQITANTKVDANLDTQVKTGNIGSNQIVSPIPTLPPVQNTINIIPQSIQFNESNRLNANTSGYFNSIVFYNNSLKDNQVLYSSSNQEILSLSIDGKYSAIKEGEVTVTIKSKMNPNLAQNILVRIVSQSTTITPTPTITVTPIPEVIVTPTVTVTPPITVTPPLDDVRYEFSLKGKIYDRNGVPVNNAKVVARSSETGTVFQSESQQPFSGSYLFKNIPVGTKLDVIVTKPEWTTRTQTIIIKSNLNNDPNINVLNFGTDGTSTNGSVIYAIQDEPEVTMLKINDRLVGSAFATDRINSSNTFSNINGTSSLLNVTPSNLGTGNNTLPGNISGGSPSSANGVGLLDDVLDPSLTGVASNTLKVELTFSEPVNKEDVEQNFRIRSQNYTATNRTPSSGTANTKSFVISNQTLTSDDIIYTWSSDSTMLTIQSKKGILANSDNATDEFRYLVDFQNGFEDSTGKKARSSSAFRFGPSQVNDFAVFSVSDDEEDPRLVSAVARDGSTSDTIELTFNEDMEVISQTSPAARLSDTITNSNNNYLSFYSVFNNNNNNENGATVLAFNDPTEAAIGTQANRYSYMIGKVLRQQISNVTTANTADQGDEVQNLRLLPLGFTESSASVQDNSNTKFGITSFPFTQDGSAQGNNYTAIREVRVRGKIVTIELDPSAYQSGDRVVVSAGGPITGSFIYQNNNKSISVTPSSIGVGATSITAATFRDPAGNQIDRGNQNTINNITSHNAQKNSSVN